MTEATTDTHIRITESLHKEMLRRARQNKRSLSKEIELALEQYIQREAGK